MRFEYHRFLLTPLNQGQLSFSDRPSREELIEKVFSEEHYTFQYRRTTYGFVKKFIRNKKVFGRIEKQRKTSIFLSPSKGFQEKQEEDWPGSHVFINLDDEKTTGQTEKSGQVIAVQCNKPIISSPINCLRALADKINEEILTNSGYYISINPILQDKRGFWSVVDEHKDKIKKVILIYTPPNLFELQNKLEVDLRKANEEFNTTSTQVVFENDGGHLKLPKDNNLLNESVDYVEQGAGGYKIFLKDGKKTIKSEAGVKTETFDGKELIIDSASDEEMDKIIQKVLMRDHHD